MIWMEHKEHGKMPCYDQATIDSNKLNGWTFVEDKEKEIIEDKAPVIKKKKSTKKVSK
jgi:hypothetical protein